MNLLTSDQYLRLRGMKQARVTAKDGGDGNWRRFDLSPEFAHVGHQHIGKTVPFQLARELRTLVRKQHHTIDKHMRRWKRASNFTN